MLSSTWWSPPTMPNSVSRGRTWPRGRCRRPDPSPQAPSQAIALELALTGEPIDAAGLQIGLVNRVVPGDQ